MPEARPYRTVSNRNFHGSEDSACRMSRNRARWRGRGRHTGEQTGLERSTHAALPVAHARRATRTCTRLVRRRTVETGACSARVSPPRSSLLSASLPSAIRRAAPPRCRRAASRRRPLTRHRRAEHAERRASAPRSVRAERLEATLNSRGLHSPQRAVQPRFRGAAPRSRRAPRQSSVHARQRVKRAATGAAVRRRNSPEATKAGAQPTERKHGATHHAKGAAPAASRATHRRSVGEGTRCARVQRRRLDHAGWFPPRKPLLAIFSEGLIPVAYSRFSYLAHLLFPIEIWATAKRRRRRRPRCNTHSRHRTPPILTCVRARRALISARPH